MTAKQKETAEQKLLKMIEVSHDAGGAPGGKSQKAVQKQGVLAVVKLINFFLIFVVVGFIVLIAFNVQSGLAYLNEPIRFNVDQNTAKMPAKTDNLVPTVQRSAYYLASVEKRNMFQPYEPADTQAAQAAVASTKMNQLLSKLKLVGVSWLDTVDSASVMIEDTENSKTYFLRRGEKIENSNITVKTIYADSAVLGYDNEEMTIRYDKSQM